MDVINGSPLLRFEPNHGIDSGSCARIDNCRAKELADFSARPFANSAQLNCVLASGFVLGSQREFVRLIRENGLC